MRIVVTGGSGFIGQHVARGLASAGHDVVIADLHRHPDAPARSIVGDLRERAAVDAAIAEGTDAVVHLAAMTSVLQSVNDPYGVFETNVGATALLLEACRQKGVGRFVFASTNAVVGDVGRSTIDENVPLHPLTPYGATKAGAEMLCSAYRTSFGVETIALRFTNVYGAGMQRKDSVVARLIRAALDGGGIEIYGDGTQVRDYLYVTDAAAAVELGLSLSGVDVLTIGAGASVSMVELHRLACEATGTEIGVKHIVGKPGEMPAVVVDTTKARSLGFSPVYDVLSGLVATWADFSTPR